MRALVKKLIINKAVSDCYLMPNEQFFQLYQGKNKLICNEKKMMSTLYKTNKIKWIFIELPHRKQLFVGRNVAPFTHIILIPSQAVCSDSLML